ncbi:MAG: adenylosuccinate synthase [bacterium]
MKEEDVAFSLQWGDEGTVDVILGLQWGDEGKGKIVDIVAPKYKIVSRAQGGPNAGHTIKFKNFEIVLHTIPSGICHEGTKNVIGNGVVLDAAILVFKEMNQLISKGMVTFEQIKERLFISKKTHLILPSQVMLDIISEKMKGNDKIGSTLKGISPTYQDKYGRNGLRIKDILSPDFMMKYQALKTKHDHIAKSHGYVLEDQIFTNGETFANKEEQFFKAIEVIKQLNLIDSEIFLNQTKEPMLAEGAQGTMLDIDFGSWPFVTSSNTTAGGICTGLGIAPNKIKNIFGVFKAYCTRVGSGPFPTELFNETGEILQKKGNEFGSTTGRPRRCGWLDLPALRYAIMLSGVNYLAMTKADVMNNFEQVLVCTKYRLADGTEVEMCSPDDMENVEAIYTAFEGWASCTNDDNLQKYVDFIEQTTGIPIVMVGSGPKREEIILRDYNRK